MRELQTMIRSPLLKREVNRDHNSSLVFTYTSAQYTWI